ncbi:ferredoxin--NADP reductase [Variovorax sp. Sphag1AA]|uniref:ferredoxin--NADP reductase n=1 Tax=Variovorax sp. Sphag1AA TaxID=2587027 RepID=UPI00160DD9D2|nr:ferredoxin--NADP reductase [Variovorax sp. Sphag1AA]MBB3182468.1 ferredoxin--NADP+ reductase [Variovorax sp. Sphag1AA]
MTQANLQQSTPTAVARAPRAATRASPGNLYEAKVLSVHHWTDRLFSFTTTRDAGFRFHSGQFTMIGLDVDGRPLLRAYSMASSPYVDTLEFLSIKVPDGALTSRLQHVQCGDTVLVGRKPSGTLLVENLLPGRVLYLLATGTGLAPFMSIVRDPEVYSLFEKIVLVHGCRRVAELAYRQLIDEELPRDPWIGGAVIDRLLYYPTVTREPFVQQGRIPGLLESGELSRRLGLAPIDRGGDRFMLCGSPAMLADTRAVLEKFGCAEGNMSRPGQYVIERAFVDK